MSGIEGLDAVMRRLDGMQGAVLDAAAEGLDHSLQRTVSVAKSLAKEGEVRRSISHVVRRTEGGIEAMVIANHERAVYQEMGTGPEGQNHNNGKAPIPVTYTLMSMIWSGRRAGTIIPGWIYKDRKTGKFVYTQGQAPSPFLYPAWKQTNRYVIKEMSKDMARSLISEYRG